MELDKNVQELAENILTLSERHESLACRIDELRKESDRLTRDRDSVREEIYQSKCALSSAVGDEPVVMEHSEKPGVIIIARHEYDRVVMFIPHEQITPAARMAYFNL